MTDLDTRENATMIADRNPHSPQLEAIPGAPRYGRSHTPLLSRAWPRMSLSHRDDNCAPDFGRRGSGKLPSRELANRCDRIQGGGMSASRTVTVLLNPRGTHKLPTDLRELQAVVLTVEPEVELSRVADRAESSAGITVPERRFLFSSPVLEDGTRRLARVPTALVDEDGILRWKSYPYDFSKNTFADLQRSQGTGVFEGDPDVIVVDHGTTGNGGWVGVWQDAINALQSLGGVGDGLGYLFYGIPVGVWRLSRRLLRKKNAEGTYAPRDSREAMIWLSDFFDRRYPAWIEQGAANATAFLDVVAAHQSWHAETLAQMIQITPAESRTLLIMLGYEPRGPTGMFGLSDSSERRELRRDVLRIALAYDPLTYEPLPAPPSK